MWMQRILRDDVGSPWPVWDGTFGMGRVRGHKLFRILAEEFPTRTEGWSGLLKAAQWYAVDDQRRLPTSRPRY